MLAGQQWVAQASSLRHRVAAFAALLALVASVVCAAPDQRPLISRAEMMSVEEVRPGMKGIGKSVFAGTRVESFGITVLGVLRRVDFGGDIILVRIDSGPPVTRGFGVVAGMSGSPVYVKGRLVGAVAYTWPFAKRPIAGVTPIAQMLEAFQPGSSPVRLEGGLNATQPIRIDGRVFQRAAVSGVAAPVAAQGPRSLTLVPVATPIMISGLSAGALPLLRAAFEPLGMTPVSGAGAMAHIDARMVPGAAVGARLVGGDLDVTAIGTVTYVSKDVVLAFGHSISGLGSAEIPLVAAYVHGVMPSAELSVKLASGGQALGRFTEDRPWCLGGNLGSPARLIRTAVAIKDNDRAVTRSYGLQVVRDRSLTAALLTSAVVGAIRSVGPPSEGTTRVSFSVKAEGLPPLTRRNTYSVEEGGGLLALLLGSLAAVASATEELNQILDALQNSEFGEAKLQELGVSVELSKRRRLARLEQVRVDKRRVRPGEEVQVTAVLRVGSAGRVERVARIRIPETCPPGRVQLGIAGGRSAEWLRSRLSLSEPRPESLVQMVRQMLRRPSNDEIVTQLALPTVGVDARGFALRDLPPAVLDVLRASSGGQVRPLRDYVEQRERTEWVLSGYAVVPLTVEGEEKDKGGRPPAPQYGAFAFEEMPPGLAGLFSGFGISGSALAVQAQAPEHSQAQAEDEVPMPSWEEVGAVGESELTPPSAPGEPAVGAPARGEAIGRLASTWRLRSEKELAGGKTEGVAVVNRGGLVLSPSPVVFGAVAAQCLWPVVAAPDGSIYVGSWSDGRLWRITSGGETTAILQTEDAAIQAVAADRDGTIYAAAVPSGVIYKVPAGEKPRVFCRTGSPNIWALAVESGVVWAGTGPEGRLLRIAADGSAVVALSVADRHIVALTRGGDGTLYLATAPRGKVYALGPDGVARSLLEVEKSSAHSLAVDGSGNVYIGTSPDARVLRIGRDGTTREVLKAKGKHVLALHAAADGTVYVAVGPEGRLYAVWPDESWAELYQAKSAFLASMTADARGALYLTAADIGQVLKLDPAGDRSGRYISPVRDAGAAARWGSVRQLSAVPAGSSLGIWTRSGNNAHPDATWSQWERLGEGPDAAVRSPVGRFLQCRVDFQTTGAAAPRLEALEVSYLSQNRAPEVKWSSPQGGEIWSGKRGVRWSARDPDHDKLSFDLFWSNDAGLTWTKIETPVQRGPEEKKKGEEEAGKTPSDPRDARSGPPASPYSGPPAARNAVSTRETALSRWRKAQTLGMEDPDEEDLMRAPSADGLADQEESMGEEQTGADATEQGPREAIPSGPALSTTSLDWDTTKAAEGACWLKVIASDRVSNPDEPLQAEVVSRPFVVDNGAPELILDRQRKDADPPPLQIEVFDQGSYITSAEFRVDEGSWWAARARDGIFDGQLEWILLAGDRLPAGSHEVEIRARDAAGNAADGKLRYAK